MSDLIMTQKQFGSNNNPNTGFQPVNLNNSSRPLSKQGSAHNLLALRNLGGSSNHLLQLSADKINQMQRPSDVD
jgi:hypothetical protein